MAGRGKGLNSKTFWTITGVVDKDGKPIRFSTIEDAQAAASSAPKSGGVLGMGSSAPQINQWQADTYENGETVISRWDPQAKDWQQVDVERDDKRADDFAKENTARAPDVVAKNQADTAESQARTAQIQAQTQAIQPKTVQRENPTTGASETVTDTQATYDRQAALDRQARAEAAQKAAYDNAMLAIARDKMTAEQARDQYQKDLDKIRLDLQREQHADTMAATKRSQDITLRGQDLDAGVSQRNADLNASTQLAGEGSRIATALLPYWNAPGQIESTNSLMAGGPPVPTQPVSKPPISPNLPLELAAAAQAQMPSRFTMPGVPPAQPTPYAMPTR